MNNDWILDILADLQRFARQNDLRALAEQLAETRLLAAAELATLAGDTAPPALPPERQTRRPRKPSRAPALRTRR